MAAKREYVGGFQGVNLRILPGVYYRVGQFKGRPIERHEVTEIATGTLVLTNLTVRFICQARGFTIPYSQLTSVLPYEDGMGLQTNRTDKPLLLSGGDGWLLYNLVMHFSQRGKRG